MKKYFVYYDKKTSGYIIRLWDESESTIMLATMPSLQVICICSAWITTQQEILSHWIDTIKEIDPEMYNEHQRKL